MALNEETLAALPDEYKSRYRALEAMFGSEGWGWVKVWATAHQQEQLLRIVNAGSWEDNRIAKGGLLTFERILGIEQEVEAEYLAYVEDNKNKEHTEIEEDNE